MTTTMDRHRAARSHVWLPDADGLQAEGQDPSRARQAGEAYRVRLRCAAFPAACIDVTTYVTAQDMGYHAGVQVRWVIGDPASPRWQATHTASAPTLHDSRAGADQEAGRTAEDVAGGLGRDVLAWSGAVDRVFGWDGFAFPGKGPR